MAGLMDELNKVFTKAQEGAKELLDKTDIDEKLTGAAKDLKGKAQELLDKTDIDEKLAGAARDLKQKAQDTFEKARPGVEEAFGKATAGAKELFDKSVEKLNAPETKDAMDRIHDQVADQVEKIRAAAKGTDPIHDFFNKKAEAEAAAAPVVDEEVTPDVEAEAAPVVDTAEVQEVEAEPAPDAEAAETQEGNL